MVFDERRLQVVEEFRHGAQDTGSLEVQIIAITQEIERLTKHFSAHAKDYSSKRGLFRMLNRRKRFLDYLKKHQRPVYARLVEALRLKAS